MKNLTIFFTFLMMAGMVGVIYAGDGQIDIAYSPYTISIPGSYIVVKDLHTPQNVNCITISTSNVIIDLNGHTLYGAGTTVGTNGMGVYAEINQNNIHVFNGVIRDFRQHGIYLYGTNQQVSEMKIFGNNSNGIYIGNASAMIWSNFVTQNGGTGIYAPSSIIRDNICTNNNLGMDGNSGSVITGNICRNNSSNGIQVESDSVVMGNTCNTNGGNGIIMGSGSDTLIKNNSTGGNTSGGIKVVAGCRVEGNVTRSNGIGIYGTSNANTIENNTIVSNDTGLRLSSAGNYFAGNRLRGNTLDISTAAGNTGGNGTHGFTNIVIPYSQPNLMILQLAGFEIPSLRESPVGIIRNLIW